MSLQMPLAYLVPSSSGPGASMTALAQLLVEVHNDFLRKCREELSKSEGYNM